MYEYLLIDILYDTSSRSVSLAVVGNMYVRRVHYILVVLKEGELKFAEATLNLFHHIHDNPSGKSCVHVLGLIVMERYQWKIVINIICMHT